MGVLKNCWNQWLEKSYIDSCRLIGHELSSTRGIKDDFVDDFYHVSKAWHEALAEKPTLGSTKPGRGNQSSHVPLAALHPRLWAPIASCTSVDPGGSWEFLMSENHGVFGHLMLFLGGFLGRSLFGSSFDMQNFGWRTLLLFLYYRKKMISSFSIFQYPSKSILKASLANHYLLSHFHMTNHTTMPNYCSRTWPLHSKAAPETLWALL